MKSVCCERRAGLWLLALTILLLPACASIDPHQVDVDLPESAPEAKITSYTQALADLGMMTEIYGTGALKIQSNPIGDNTGTSGATGGEVPRSITEMVKSSLNSIGGSVIYIPYDPAFIQNQMVTGYSNFDQKLIPDVVITGGITEFDRGLETRGENTDIGAEAEFRNAPSFMPSKTVALDYGAGSKAGLARITLDFNMLNFQTMAGISKMNTVNSIKVHKGLSEKEIGITLFGPTFGSKGSIKKVQGRHAAVRLLVEVSMLQMVGKYLVLPYWRLLGEGSTEDAIVVSALTRSYYRMSAEEHLAGVQEWLYLHGYDIPMSGQLDNATKNALKGFDPNYDLTSNAIGKDLFVKLYLTIPIDDQTYGRRQQLEQLYAQQVAPEPVAAAPEAASQAPAAAAAQAAQQAPAAEPVATVKSETQLPRARPTGRKKASVGRMLSDDEW